MDKPLLFKGLKLDRITDGYWLLRLSKRAEVVLTRTYDRRWIARLTVKDPHPDPGTREYVEWQEERTGWATVESNHASDELAALADLERRCDQTAAALSTVYNSSHDG